MWRVTFRRSSARTISGSKASMSIRCRPGKPKSPRRPTSTCRSRSGSGSDCSRSARTDNMIDAVRDRGVEGYDAVVRRFAHPDWEFRLALWLHRRLGYARALTVRLADRFEILMVSQDVLAELAAFNLRSVGDLLGREAEEKLGEIIKARQQLVDRALKALSLQYPGYAESVKDRELERAAIRLESAEYARRL